MKIDENQWKSTKINENRRKLAKIVENLRKSMKIDENRLKSVKIYENLLKSVKIDENRRKSVKIDENQRTSTKILEHRGHLGVTLGSLSVTLAGSEPWFPIFCQKKNRQIWRRLVHSKALAILWRSDDTPHANSKFLFNPCYPHPPYFGSGFSKQIIRLPICFERLDPCSVRSFSIHGSRRVPR